MRLSPGFTVALIVDDAPYESVVAVLDELKRIEIDQVHMFPPFLGTNLSNSVKHWIRFIVDGEINHPFPMVLIATESLRTWREHFIVLPVSEFGIVDRLATARIEQGDYATSVTAIPKDLLESEHRLLLFEHSEDGTRSCLLPRAATSCEFLSRVIGATNVVWATGDLQAIRSVAGEIGCDIGN
jgi:hypothetical protein